EYVIRNGGQIGGIHINENDEMEPEIVEIDESLISKVLTEGDGHKQHGALEGLSVELANASCLRTRQTLEEAKVEHILPGTHIISDGWSSYAHLDEIDDGIYSHSVIIHDQHFVDPTDDCIHTQSVEGT
ncbi:hypothetical protein TCAL_15973, partial [Tigriopus californicus]